MAKRNSPLRQMIRESVQELKEGSFPDDPRIGDDAEEMTGPERFAKGQKSKDEIVIDSLLADISGKTGYFLKLKKEVRPNEWMMMKTIENEWRKWADTEVEVANIVIEHTKRDRNKWGSGLYRVEFACKNGIRGKNYDPVDFYVNAEEEFLNPTNTINGQPTTQVDPSVQVASQIETLSNLVSMLGNVFPKPQDPSVLQTQIAQAFQQGLQVKVGEGSSSTQMMMAMMTMMMTAFKEFATLGRVNEPKVVNPEDTMSKMLGVMKEFGVLGAAKEVKEKSVIDFANELKVLGIDLFKKEDMAENITKLKQMAGIVTQFMGMQGESEKPSIIEKIIDVVGPAIPGMIKDIKETAEKAVQVQQIAGQNIQRATQRNIPIQPAQPIAQTETMVGEKTTYQQVKGDEVNVQQNGNSQVSEQVKMFFNQLYDSVKADNKMFYPVVYTSMLQDQKGIEIINGLVANTKNVKDVIDLLQLYGDDRFKNSEFVMKSLVGYVNGYVVWIRQMAGEKVEQPIIQTEQKVNEIEFDVVCKVCGTVYTYPNEKEFNEDEKKCETSGCTGLLESMAPDKIAG